MCDQKESGPACGDHEGALDRCTRSGRQGSPHTVFPGLRKAPPVEIEQGWREACNDPRAEREHLKESKRDGQAPAEPDDSDSPLIPLWRDQ